MTEITGEKMDELLRLATEDHKRGCEGRNYTCTCGYDYRVRAALSSPARSAEGMVTDEMVEAGAKAHYERQVIVGVVDGYFATTPWEKLDPSYTSSYRKAVRVILNAALSLSTQPGTEAEADDPSLWRFWNDKARSLASRVQELEKALREAENAFEAIRLILIKDLAEPERSAFWKAVGARDAIRAALTAREEAR